MILRWMRLMRYIQEHDRTSSYYSVRSFREDIRTLREEFDAPILPTNRGIYRYDTEFDLYFEFGMTDKFPDLKLRI
jgi:hypothetical protein